MQTKAFLRENAEKHAKSAGVSLQPVSQVMQQVHMPTPGNRVTAEEVEKVSYKAVTSLPGVKRQVIEL